MSKTKKSAVEFTSQDVEVQLYLELEEEYYREIYMMDVREANSLRALVDFLNGWIRGEVEIPTSFHPINTARIQGNRTGFATKEALVARFVHWRRQTTEGNRLILDKIDDDFYRMSQRKANEAFANDLAQYELDRTETLPDMA